MEQMTPKPPMTEEELNKKRAKSSYWIEYLARVYDAKGKNSDKEAFNEISLQGIQVVAPSLKCNKTGKCRTMMFCFRTIQAVPVSKKGLHISVAKFDADIDYDAILEKLNKQIDEMVLTEEIVFAGYISPTGSLVVVSELSSVPAVSLLNIVDNARMMLKELDSKVTFQENHISLGHPNTREMVIEYEALQQRTQASKTSWCVQTFESSHDRMPEPSWRVQTSESSHDRMPEPSWRAQTSESSHVRMSEPSWRTQASEPLHTRMPEPSWRAPISGISWRTKACESSRAQPSESSNVKMHNSIVWQ
jgi:hypothetical protein